MASSSGPSGHRVGWARLLPQPAVSQAAPVDRVRELLAHVRNDGDAAVRMLTKRFDGVDVAEPRVDVGETAAAWERIPQALRDALSLARRRIADFHADSAPTGRTHTADGVTVRTVAQPVDRAGIYVPGGLAAYPSTVLMTVLPARAAGVAEIALCSPPGPDGSLSDAVLAAAHLCEVDELYRIGGVQAVAALAYGTATIPAVDVIAGPGNAWVATAQREVAAEVRVAAAFAGPSETAIVADDTCPPTSAAVDLVLQAEHGPGGRAWLLAWDEAYAEKVEAAAAAIVDISPRREATLATLLADGRLCLVDGPEHAVDVANAIAPEHLQLACAGAAELATRVRHAGAVFVGPWTPASLGDYVAGPSHVLPTNGTARFAGALGVADFQKQMHVVEAGRDGFAALAESVACLAEAEGLWAHAASVAQRERWAADGVVSR
ncbi:histidinol dehydrogenase [Microbacterium maritypicum]|uniref:histidinol dehydrogenase n=1 Tax=Microbacterium maritypicum TaxID=33918 RepID=UPI00296F591E|nr:histidinol dehydrogenase [Microbacterium liquefaciens]